MSVELIKKAQEVAIAAFSLEMVREGLEEEKIEAILGRVKQDLCL